MPTCQKILTNVLHTKHRSVYDTKIGKQGVATSGHLMPYSDLQFGMYIPVRCFFDTFALAHICAKLHT